MQQERDQRRSHRHRCVLDVDLSRGDKKFAHVKSYDVSRHGLFVLIAEPPAERFLVQLVVQLPDGPLPATAFVSRLVPQRGAGLEMFALSAQSKERWDRFINTLDGRPESKSFVPSRVPERATFLVRLRSEKRLQEFLEKNFESGGLYMATPVIKEMNAEIALAIIHPLTEQEFLLAGRVQRVCRDRPKGMEVQLIGIDAKVRHSFHEFVKTGFVPRTPSQSRTTQPPQSSSPSSSPPTPHEESGDISIDIIVDESALEESEQFAWGEVSSDLVIDFEVAEWQPDPASFPVDVECLDCRQTVAGVRMGDAEGALGHVAEHRVYECAKCGTLKSAIRVKPVEERRRVAASIDPWQTARISDLFAAAELGAVPRCSECGGNLKSTGAAKSFEKLAGSLVRGESAPIADMRCPECGRENLRMVRKLGV